MHLPEAVFKENLGVMGPYAGVDYNSPYLIVNYAVSYPPPLQGKGVEWRKSLLLVVHICICLLISKTGFL
jgi:hypothetical protein